MEYEWQRGVRAQPSYLRHKRFETRTREVLHHFDDGRDIREMKPKLLIVDDDVAITQQLFWMLCDQFDVTTANDLASAVRRATIYEPDVAILDLHLPPTLNSPDTGMRVLEYVKSHLPATKVFVVSSAAGIELQQECLSSGADGFLSKPLDVEQLLSAVRSAGIEQQLNLT
jgi:DNA-binding NarL/FixJ family response regulator